MSKQTSSLLKGTWFNRKAILLIDSPVFLLSTYYVLSTVLMLEKEWENRTHSGLLCRVFISLAVGASSSGVNSSFSSDLFGHYHFTEHTDPNRQTHTHIRLDKGSWLDKGPIATVEAAWIWDSQWDLLSLGNWRCGFRWVVAGLQSSGLLCPVDLSCLRFP